MRRAAAFALLALTVFASTDCGRSERARVLTEMARRPSDPWPRGAAHVLLAEPGSGEYEKAYEEAGGSFSPSAGSFGISLWVLDSAGRIVATSDSLPLSQVKGGLVWSNGALPEIAAETTFYKVLWRCDSPGLYEARVNPRTDAGQSLAVVVRSVGPAGGPVRTLSWNGGVLRVNGRWSVVFPPSSEFAGMGKERDPNWTREAHGGISLTDAEGWGYARIVLHGEGTISVRGPGEGSGSHLKNLRPEVYANLPDARFDESLRAQAAHQEIALVGDQTRPGDPMNYPLAWQRDGAYTVASLARAGRLDAARPLALYMANHDFYGGFGPEADAPGLGIWCIEETATRLRDPGFDASVFPAVKRKAEWIERMLQTRDTIRTDVYGVVIPQYRRRRDLNLVAEPAREGLIVGRMDWQRPLLFVNAVSYAGLRDAAEMADRLGRNDAAERWRRLAAGIRNTWGKALATPERDNDRTFISGLWPSWIASGHPEFAQALDARWAKTHTDTGEPVRKPLWTYFDMAEAHQYLLLGRPERAWSILRWFWNHQAAPGMYTWWEGSGEENSFGRWETVRGWVRPPDVEPHYWTAAETLLLQLDMLAYDDESAAAPTVVIGAGVLPEWISQPMEVRGASTKAAVVDWRWTGSRLIVDLHGAKAKVVAGSAFPQKVNIVFANESSPAPQASLTARRN
jgi:hypothetical protein